ncbi:MAG: signal peptidase II, partial [Pseudomonadales bacterium]|nr:signal peptidase II [Pseudomonadales bacterium]
MPNLNVTHTLRWFAIAATVLLLDQLAKLWIMADFALGDSRYISGFFNLVRAHNEGAAFSFLSDAG